MRDSETWLLVGFHLGQLQRGNDWDATDRVAAEGAHLNVLTHGNAVPRKETNAVDPYASNLSLWSLVVNSRHSLVPHDIASPCSRVHLEFVWSPVSQPRCSFQQVLIPRDDLCFAFGKTGWCCSKSCIGIEWTTC
jgi:hypothetical protein